MKANRNLLIVSVFLLVWAAAPPRSGLAGADQEYVTTSPALADGVLFVGSTALPARRGHLRAIDIADTFPVMLWDAAEEMPLAGGDAAQPETILRNNSYRHLFTAVDGTLLPLDAAAADRLQEPLEVASPLDAAMLLSTLRGRSGVSPAQPKGRAEDPQRLWGISRSSPLLVGRSLRNSAATQRDRVLYVGAEDGLLHAFFVSRWNDAGGSYLVDDPDGGTELWAFLPGSFLAHLKEQPFHDATEPLAVHLDGTPVATEVFLDLNGDGRRHWHTLLAATGTIFPERRSALFVIDITDPYRPMLLWETLLPVENAGRTRGVAVDRCGGGVGTCLYLTADSAVETGNGIHALAVNLEDGALLWQFSAAYAATGPVASATPAVPALLDVDGDGRSDTLVFGDLVGRLWALALKDGRAYGDAPVYVTPGGPDEPIGAGVSVYDNVALFGTGGVAGAAEEARYSLYAVEIRPEGSRLRWSYPLAPGEQVWQPPTVDASGNLVFATATGYPTVPTAGVPLTSGRVIALNRSGAEEASRATNAATVGRVVAASGVAVSVDLTGEVAQFGTAARLTSPSPLPAAVKILSWRPR